MPGSRRSFIKKSAIGTMGLAFGGSIFNAKSYGRIIGANDRINVGIVGFSDRAKSTLIPSFLSHHSELNFDITGISDIWNKRREEGAAFISEKIGHTITPFQNNEALYDSKSIDAVIISTADFQHAFHSTKSTHAHLAFRELLV